MLDLDFNNFPKAYIVKDNHKFIFSKVKFNKKYLDCSVKIFRENSKI